MTEASNRLVQKREQHRADFGDQVPGDLDAPGHTQGSLLFDCLQFMD